MSKISGAIKVGNTTIVDFLSIQLSEREDPQAGLKEWHGSCYCTDSRIVEAGTYTLLLRDKRAGQIIITHYDPSTGYMEFSGSGALK